MTETLHKVHGPTVSAPSEVGDQQARFTRVTSSFPAEVSKIFELKGGELVKTPSANIGAGHVEIVDCSDLQSFAKMLTELRTNQCLVYGVPPSSPLKLMSDAKWVQAGRPADAISRTEANFRWLAGTPGILMLDHDPQPGMPPYAPDTLVSLLRAVVPELRDADMLTWPSASSLIFDARTGARLAPLKGSRVYLMVDDAARIPELGKHIVSMLWSEGHGVFAVSRSGSVLERGLFDTSVWQTNRIDFAAGASCRPPLEQRRGQPVLHVGSARMVHVNAGADGAAPLSFALTESQMESAAANKRVARMAVDAEAAVVRSRYANEKSTELEAACVAAGVPPDVAHQRAKSTVQAMLRTEAPELHGEAVVTIVRDDALPMDMTVNEILTRRAEFDGALTLDPLEPEYNNHSVVGKLYLRGAVPRLFSFAHGGATYKLVSRQGAVAVTPGFLHRAVDETLALLRGCGDLYDHGDAIAMVGADGRMLAIPSGLVPYVLSSRVSFYNERTDTRTGEIQRREEDPPAAVARSIFELGRGRHLPRLNAVITAPIIVDGRLIAAQGYDAASGLVLLHAVDDVDWNQRPGIAEVQDALAWLLEQFDTFPFDAPADRGAFLAALFTAVMRPGLRTAPGFAFDAPAQGTGKSLLTECVAIIGTGSAPSALPHLYDDEAEVRKRLMSMLYSGAAVMIWDNVKGTFDSAVLASLLTSEQFNDRMLGETRQLCLPNRMLALFNGNNVELRGELTRRIIVCRLDARVEQPYLRLFTSSPRALCLAERTKLVQKVLTVIRGYQLHGDGFADVSLGSFEEWSAAVLRPLLWAAFVCCEDRVGNPIDKITMGEAGDEDVVTLANLHRRWYERFGDTPQTARDVVRNWMVPLVKKPDAEVFDTFDDEDDDELNVIRDPIGTLDECINEFIGWRNQSGSDAARALALGKQLGYRKGRVFDGDRLFVKQKRLASGGVARWSATFLARAASANKPCDEGGVG